MTEQFKLEGTLQRLSNPNPLQGVGTSQSPVQPDLQHSQEWGIYHLFGKPVVLLHHPHCKKLSYLYLNGPTFNLNHYSLSCQRKTILCQLNAALLKISHSGVVPGLSCPDKVI